MRATIDRWLKLLWERLRREPLGAVLLIGSIASVYYVVAYPLSVVRYPPITDLPFHASMTSILRHYWDPSWHFREQFELHFLQAPYWTMYGLGALLALVMPIAVAMKVATAMLLAMLPAGLAVMFHAMKRSPYLGLMGLVLVWNTLTHWGFINFVGALGLFAMVVGLAILTLDAPSRRKQVLLSVALLLVFGSHIFRYPFAIAAVIGTAVVMYPATRRWKQVLLPMVPSLVLFALFMVLRNKESTSGAWKLALHWNRLDEMLGFLFGGFRGTEERQLAVRALWVIAGVGGVCLGGFFVERRWRGWTRRDWLFAIGATLVPLSCALVFFVMYLTLPMEIGLWWYVYPREITTALLLAMGLVPSLPKPNVAKLPAVVAVVWATGSQAFYVAKQYAFFDANTEDFERIVSQIPKAPKLGYMVFEHGGSTRATTPYIHLPAWVQATRGGWLSFHFVSWGYGPMGYRPGSSAVPPPTPLRFEWTPERFDLATRGKWFDWFLVRSAQSPEGKFSADPSLRLVDKQGTWWLFQRQGAAAK